MLPTQVQRPLILIAEDEAIIGLELADSLEREGFEIAGPFATCVAAEEWLVSNEPVAAIIDNRLRDGPCEALARDLTGRAVPFVVYSGDHVSNLPAAFGTWVGKPAPFEHLRRLLLGLIERPDRAGAMPICRPHGPVPEA